MKDSRFNPFAKPINVNYSGRWWHLILLGLFTAAVIAYSVVRVLAVQNAPPLEETSLVPTLDLLGDEGIKLELVARCNGANIADAGECGQVYVFSRWSDANCPNITREQVDVGLIRASTATPVDLCAADLEKVYSAPPLVDGDANLGANVAGLVVGVVGIQNGSLGIVVRQPKEYGDFSMPVYLEKWHDKSLVLSLHQREEQDGTISRRVYYQGLQYDGVLAGPVARLRIVIPTFSTKTVVVSDGSLLGVVGEVGGWASILLKVLRIFSGTLTGDASSVAEASSMKAF